MNFLIIIIFIGLGWLAKNNHWINVKQTSLINRYVIFICLPAIILLKIPQLSIDQSVIFPSLMAWLLIPFLVTIILLLAKVYGWSKEIVGCLLLVVCFGNTSFVGFPIIQAFYGENALAYAVIYDQIGSFLSLAIIGNFFIARYSVQEIGYSDNTNQEKLKNNSSQLFFKKVLAFPPFIALVVAFLIRDFNLPLEIQQLFWLISLTLVPATMFLVGLHFELQVPEAFIRPLRWAIITKMVLAPIIAVLILTLFKQNGLHTQITLMESAMPPMVTASILAIHAKLAPKLAAAAVGYGLITAIFVIPLVYLFSGLIK